MSYFSIVLEIASWVFILSGGVCVVIGAIGMLRFPDFWTRLHGASVIDSMGVILLIVGLLIQAGISLVAFKLILIGIFLFITGPTSTHAIANAALVSGLKKSKEDNFND